MARTQLIFKAEDVDTRYVFELYDIDYDREMQVVIAPREGRADAEMMWLTEDDARLLHRALGIALEAGRSY